MSSDTDLRDIWSSVDDLVGKLPDSLGLWERLKEEVDFASFRPEKATGIIERRLESNREGEYYILKNPHAGTYLKLSDRDYYLWSLMDGTRSVKDLVMEYFVKYSSFGFARARSLVTQLRSNFFLTEQPAINTFDNLRRKLNRGTFGHRADRFWKSFLNKQFALRGVDSYISRAYKTVGWIFFTKPMQVLYLILVGLGMFFFIRQLNSTRPYSILRMWNSYGLGFLTVLVIYIAIVAIHETAHAFAAKSYGRDIRSGGFLIYFGMPAFFIDTMDIWMEPRRARIVVSWAGPYSQLILGGLCSMIAAMFPETAIGSFLFKFAFFSYLWVFINLTPLLELDGYFILMDWLDIPLLRRKSLEFVKKELWSKILQREKFSRDEKIFTVFGILAGIWSVCAILIAIYLWERRIFGALIGVLERSLMHKLYLGAIVLIFGIPLLVVLVMKVVSVIYAGFAWIGDSKYFKTNSNLIALLVGVSMALATVCYLLPEGSLQTHKEILKLVVLFCALFFAVKDIFCHREGRLEKTFRFLAVFVFFLFIADLVSAFSSRHGVAGMGYDTLAEANIFDAIHPMIRIGAYSSLLLSMSTLAGKDFRLCRWGERLMTLILLMVLGLLVFMAVRLGSQSQGWWEDLVPMLNLLLPVVLGSLAFVLLIPSCFVYQRTEFLKAWMVLVLSLVWMSTASVLSFYEETSRSAMSFYVLSYALLASALFSHYVIYTRVRVAHAPGAAEVALKYDDKQRLRSAFANICEAIFSQIISVYGERITQYVQDRLNTRSQRSGWGLKAVHKEIEDNVPEAFNIISLGEVYREFLSRMLNLTSDVAGETFVRKAMQRGCDRLYWEEREVAYEYLISPLERVKTLAEEFQMTKKSLMSMLEGMAIFSGLSQEELFLISSRLRVRKFRKGTDIVKQGDVGDELYIVRSGQVEVSVRDDTHGSERIVAHFNEGDYFGEIALLGDMPRTATCRATRPVEAWVLDKTDFNQLVRRHLDLPEKLDRAVANMTMLQRMPLFTGLTYKKINTLLSMLKPKTLPAGTVVIKQGDPGDAFYIIKSGEVIVRAGSEAGEKTVAKLGEAEYFGEIALITGQPRTATVTSVSETELLVLEKSNFDAVVELISSDLEQASSRRWLDTRRKLREEGVEYRT